MVYENNGYITGFTNSEENNAITEAMKNVPVVPNGYGCRLKDDLTWEVFKFPESTEPTETEATEADYISALEDLGVQFNG